MATFAHHPDLSEADIDWLNRFADGEAIGTSDQAVQLLCILQAVVSWSGVTSFPTVAADCVCGQGPFQGNAWRNGGDSFRFIVKATARALSETAVAEGWWHPNVKSGQVHDHPENPGRGWSEASHRQCEPVYTHRALALTGAVAP